MSGTVDIVVSAYQQNLAWVGALRPPGARVFVYDKWDDGDASEAHAFWRSADPDPLYRRLPNVGLCDHTYLHHIADNYSSLADWTVFTPDGPHDHLPEGARMEDCLTPGESLRVPRLWRGRDWNPVTGRLNWLLWGSNPKRGGISWKEWFESGKVTPAELSFVEWAKHYVGFDVNSAAWPGYAPGGIYAVPRRCITYLPLAFYERLRDQLIHAREPEECHYCERSLVAVFQGKARYIPEGKSHAERVPH